jgi:hypothetical protein
MATPKYQGIKLGPGGLEVKAGECEIFSKTVAPVDGIPGVGDGKDGDLWIQVSGGTSTIYQKANHVWISISPVFSGAPIALADGVVNQLAFSYTAIRYPSAVIEYFVSTPGGTLERGEMTVMNDGTNAEGSVHNVQEINGPLGVSFDFVVNGFDVEVRYDADLLGLSRTLLWKIRR